MLLQMYAKSRTFLAGLPSTIRTKLKSADGAVATEYGLLLVLIALAIIVAATALGIAIATVFNTASSSLSTV